MPIVRCSVVDHRITGTSTMPPRAVPTPTRNGPPPPLSIFREMKFHAPVKPTQMNEMPARYIQKRGASRNTAPTAPRRPSCWVRLGASGSIVAVHSSTSRLANA